MTNGIGTIGKRFLLWCANEHLDFRIPEIQSIAKLLNIKLRWIDGREERPFFIVEVEKEEEIRKLMKRAILVRSAYELWASADTHQELYKNLVNIPSSSIEPFCDASCSYKIRIETFCKSLTQMQKLEKIHELSFLPFNGSVDLENPDAIFHLIEYYGTNPNNVPEKPHSVYFGRWITDGQRRTIMNFTLKTRKFIGNTTMDPQLSLIMANHAMITSGSLVYDPFVGSGSLLVAAAHYGAYVWGADIDYKMLHGKAKPTRINTVTRDPDESVSSNMVQYGLERHYLDVIVADSSVPIWRKQPLFDAIVADPPYGIREATERIGSHKKYKIPPHLVNQHIPSKVEYSMGEMYRDLLNFAAHHLRLNGRLVFWLPVYRLDYTAECVPKHSCLQLISNCEQVLTKTTSRRLITMEKIKEPTENCMVHPAESLEMIDKFREHYFRPAGILKKNSRDNNPHYNKESEIS